ncbi:MAG: GGDEF domain-containing protein [Lachnospiraceae bacterium]|nr:GGDEF domain-containing protein [Lachnospiraceae bacterium]
MKQFVDELKKMISGEIPVSQQKKLEVISVAVTVVHLVLVAIFAYLDVWVLIFYNILTVIYYVYAFRQVSENKILKGYVLFFFEIVFQSILMTLVIGVECGFSNYLFAIIPVFFYINSTYDKDGTRIWQPLLSTLIAALVFIATAIIDGVFKPVFELTTRRVHFLLIFNSVLSMFLLAAMSLFFILENRDSLKVLTVKNKDLGQQASEDPLTGLSNRRSMELVLEAAMARARERGVIFSLVMGDIDNFKKINDTYGHDCGDEALTAVAEIFRTSVRDGDHVCRWGGEEFLILISGNNEMAVAAAERIRKRIEANVVTYQGVDVRFTMTFGVTTYVPGFSLETLITQADDNLYTGKKTGKNKVVSTER